ncbi:50S ribosomal protein L18 [bacterium (Candidatus Torokbacteria) CG_4_10_14_0_2_um_filter_35_8]|nr:MAG: 50S ribosomal protein L18 [bacterium (Candidatus Torokbacteria) CG_4_10_14_0_2_um_filter_35_8]
MKNSKLKYIKRKRRHHRVRAKISGTSDVPRLSVFRSNKGMYVQLVDDVSSKTIVGISLSSIPKSKKKLSKTEQAKVLGNMIAKRAKEKKIKKAVFDRGGYKYHGKVKALAEGAREGGLKF